MQKKDFVSLAEARPDLAAEWNYEKNGNLRPEDVGAHSSKKMWWKLPYDVPMDYKVEKLRGKHFEFEWEAVISGRCIGDNCPYLSGRATWEGFNDLQTVKPELAKQWHPTKNGKLKPSDVTTGSKQKVWWLLPYDDKNGNHFNFEWNARINDRVSHNSGCPFFTGAAVWPGFNDLQTINPELAAQWHPTKNGNLTPTQIAAKSNKKVWWLYPYNVPEDYPIKSLRGRHFDFEWMASPNSRNKGRDCPFLTGNMVWKGFNDLNTAYPELARQWHSTKNGNLKPEDVHMGAHLRVWWYLPYDIPMDYKIEFLRGKHFDFEWCARVNDRVNYNTGCPFLAGKNVLKGFNDLQTTNPELAKQWHPIKNGDLKPHQIMAASNKKVWWIYPYDIPADYKIKSLRGKHFDFEWIASPNKRRNENSCPFLSSHAVWPGFNDLQTVNPELAKQWHPTKNGNLKPTDITSNSSKKVWWFLKYKIPDDYTVINLRGKCIDFEWQADIAGRNNGNGCPFLSGHAVWPGFNDLQTVNQELAEQWHPTMNGNLRPTNITSITNKKVWWLLRYDVPKDYPLKHLRGKHFDFEWKSRISDRTAKNATCPYLCSRSLWKGFNDLQTVNPNLAKEWHPTKNNELTPSEIVAGSCKKVWWILPYDDKKTGQHFDFEWQATVRNRNRGIGCPYLHTYKGEEYIKQYFQKNNITFTPQQKFPDLIGTGGGQLSYDFSIYSKKYGFVLIEYNGIQHYESSEFFGGDKQLKKQKEHDRLKKEYAKKHGYKLIIVKYTYDTYEDVTEYLEKELKKSDESVFDSASKTRLHQISNVDSPFFVDKMNGKDIKTAEKEVIKESTEENKEKIGKIEEKAGENIVCNKEENVA